MFSLDDSSIKVMADVLCVMLKQKCCVLSRCAAVFCLRMYKDCPHLFPAFPPGLRLGRTGRVFTGKSQEEVSHQIWPCVERSWADRACVAEAPSITNHRPHAGRWLTHTHLLQLGTFQSDENRDVTDSEQTE